MKDEKLELLIIGGGVTGAGIAVQAGVKGIKTGLIEMQDFAAGASSRSTKLVHGGLRYLKNFEVGLVSDVTHERQVLSDSAPHIVKPSPTVFPIYNEKGATFDSFSGSVLLKLYDDLAEVKEKYRHYFVDKEKALELEPALREEGLETVGYYLDFLNDDARLTIENIKKAHEVGARIANYVKAIHFLYEGNQIVGVKAEDTLTGEQFDIQASVVVNATGPWSDRLRKDNGQAVEYNMHPAKGVHLVVDNSKLKVDNPIYTDSGMGDGRIYSVIPRRNKTYFGTTDTDYKGDLSDPDVTSEDVDYLLKAVNHRFPTANITLEDVETSWSGLRPLVQDELAKDSTQISRKQELYESEDGLVTIAGGKLTDFRLMAEETVETVEKHLKVKTGKEYPQIDTKTLRVSGGNIPNSDLEAFVAEKTIIGKKYGLSEEVAVELAKWFGSNVEQVFELTESVKGSSLPLREALSLRYSLENEMVVTPLDYFWRRTDSLLFDSQYLDQIKDRVIEEMAIYFDWDIETKEKYIRELENRISTARLEHLKTPVNA